MTDRWISCSFFHTIGDASFFPCTCWANFPIFFYMTHFAIFFLEQMTKFTFFFPRLTDWNILWFSPPDQFSNFALFYVTKFCCFILQLIDDIEDVLTKSNWKISKKKKIRDGQANFKISLPHDNWKLILQFFFSQGQSTEFLGVFSPATNRQNLTFFLPLGQLGQSMNFTIFFPLADCQNSIYFLQPIDIFHEKISQKGTSN